jgi:hypothetical protein
MNAEDRTDRSSPDNLLYDGANHVVKAEEKHIEAWRGRRPQGGLALSGGGIRSASYCPGVLPALAYKRARPNVDYLSRFWRGLRRGVADVSFAPVGRRQKKQANQQRRGLGRRKD